ncbi:MAG: TnpV protein [Oscillospiraceae bacterium]|nr:TnpV protein [Oscillospiraceae bacterium]
MKTLEQKLWERNWNDQQLENDLQKQWLYLVCSPLESDDHLNGDGEDEAPEDRCKRLQELAETVNKEQIGMYGMERKRYLKQYQPEKYQKMRKEITLLPHLVETNIAAINREMVIVHQMEEAQGVTEELKSRDQLKWVGLENNIIHSAREIVRNELIYV